MDIIILQDFILVKRIESLLLNLNRKDYIRFHLILNKTIYNIKNYEICFVNYSKLQSYLEKIEIAQLLCFCECYDHVRQELYKAKKIVQTNFEKIMDQYINIK